MKERLIKLYRLNKIDKELAELHELKGDLPQQIEELNEQKSETEEALNELTTQLQEIETKEEELAKQIKEITTKIERDDILLREGGVSSNKEYEALAKEIEMGYEKIEEHENLIESELKPKKDSLTEKINSHKQEFDEMSVKLAELEEELKVLSEQNQEEESGLNSQRTQLLSEISQEDLDYYERINAAMYGDAVAVVRKGSCLGCYSSVPPQKAIEIRMAERFFNCESCGRILIAEELISQIPAEKSL